MVNIHLCIFGDSVISKKTFYHFVYCFKYLFLNTFNNLVLNSNSIIFHILEEYTYISFGSN